MTQTKEKWSSLVLSRADLLNGMKVPWYCVFSFFFFFLFTTSGKKEHLHETIFVTVTVITVFRKSYSESYLISAMFKVLFEHF